VDNCYTLLLNVCSNFTDTYSISSSSYNNSTWWFPWLIFASFCGNAMLYGIIAYDPKLRVHPMALFATIAFLDGSLFWIYLTEPYMCSSPENPDRSSIFYAVTFPRTLNANIEQQYLTSVNYQDWLNFLKAFFWTASMVFNICICFDLILMIKHPFDSKSSRIFKYHIASYTVGIIAGVEKLFFNDHDWFRPNSYLTIT
jgi:hypothetical protein